MPEVHVRVRWPDGSTERCFSPSRLVEQALTEGASYPLEEFVRRSRDALTAGSDRLRRLRGFACTAAAAQIASIETTAAAFACDPTARVTVEAIERGPEPTRHGVDRLEGHVPVVVVGAGQAGLSVAACLRARGIDHLLIERDRVGHAWRDERWDSFCLVTPNFQCRVPGGYAYAGDDPEGFIGRDEIVAFLEGYAEHVDPPLVEGVDVVSLDHDDAGTGFVVRTTAGTLHADEVVIATGGYHVERVPEALAGRLPAHVAQVHSRRYRSPAALPDGAVLVIGTGQSGAQIAEDLHVAGRDVHLCVGSAPRVARRYRGRDVVTWLEDMGRYDLPVDEHPEGVRTARAEVNHYVTGRDGGHDLDLRELAKAGLLLHGRALAVHGSVVTLAPTLVDDLDNADATYNRINASIDRHIAQHGIDAPPGAAYEADWAPGEAELAPELDLDAAGIATVVWATGFRRDYSWVTVPCFDGTGYPVHERGVTTVPGLSVVGLPWLHTWGSGRFAGVARDAEHVVERVAARLGRRASEIAAA